MSLRGRHLAAALAASALLGLLPVLLVHLLADLRWARLYHLRTGEGLALFWVGVELVADALVLTVAYALSGVACGFRRRAPRQVRAARVGILVVVGAIVLGALAVSATVSHQHCFRTCNPFPA